MDVARARKLARPYLAGLAAAGLAAGFAARLAGASALPDAIWAAVTIPVLLALVTEIVTSLRRGDLGLDIVAALSMTAALAVGQELAAAIVALMYAGGQYLESFAERAARREMTALLSRVPRAALRHRDGRLEEVALDLILPGDRLLVRQGDVVPVDGTVAGVAVLDQSALTGEALPVRLNAGEAALSGSTNAGEAFDLLATRRAAESTYAGIVRLVEAAQRSRAPMSRLADRYAILFLAVTVALAGAAWALTGEAVRAVAVLVVATPCPLILAVPVAIVSGLSRAAKLGILIKGGKAIEMLAQVRALVIDKTGTLTLGQAKLVETRVTGTTPPEEVLRLAASLDQASKHIIAQTIVADARARGLALAIPSEVVETPGEGIAGTVDGHKVLVGGLRFIAAKLGSNVRGAGGRTGPRCAGGGGRARRRACRPAHPLRRAARWHRATAAAPCARSASIASCWRPATATRWRALSAPASPSTRCAPSSRPTRRSWWCWPSARTVPVMMIGDGVNDAPALAAADIGMAMGARGAAASAEAADVVLLVDQLDRVLPAIQIARRSRAIAIQSVIAGMGLSIAAMIAAAFGFIAPVEGALLQEAIDVAVIINALRALRG